MEYRINQRTGDKISVIGIGSSYLSETPEKEALETLEMAYENGINYIDLAAGAAECFSYYPFWSGLLIRRIQMDNQCGTD